MDEKVPELVKKKLLLSCCWIKKMRYLQRSSQPEWSEKAIIMLLLCCWRRRYEKLQQEDLLHYVVGRVVIQREEWRKVGNSRWDSPDVFSWWVGFNLVLLIICIISLSRMNSRRLNEDVKERRSNNSIVVYVKYGETPSTGLLKLMGNQEG